MSRSKRETPFNELLTDIKQNIFFCYDGFDDFVIASNEMAKTTNAEIGKKIEVWNKENPNLQYSGFEIYENEFFKLVNYENEIDFAIMILAYSKLEVNLNNICRLIAVEKKKKILSKDLNGKGIFQSKKYLEKIFELDLTSISEDWKKIEIYNNLRNTIVHQNGQFIILETQKLTENDMYKKLITLTDCTISQNGLISISKDTIKEFIKLSESVLNTICELLRETKNATPNMAIANSRA